MALLLAIDTSTAQASVAVCSPDNILAETSWVAGREHSRHLTAQITHLLNLTGETPDHLSAVVAALGPGSFSGIRVGLAEAKGICLALDLPLIGIPTLDYIAWGVHLLNPEVLAVIPAGRGDVYAATYGGSGPDWGRTGDYRILSIQEAVGLAGGRLVAGDGAGLLGERDPDLALPPPAFRIRRASFLAELGRRRLETNGVEDMDTIEPLYLRRSSAEEKAAERARS